MINVNFIGLDSSEYLMAEAECSERDFKKVSRRVMSVQTVFSYKKSESPRNKVSFTVVLKGSILHSEASSEDMYKAIAEAASKMKRQIASYESRLKDV